MDRSDRIPLPRDVSRCEPAKRGPGASRCARATAAILQGSPVGDFSDNPEGCTVVCPWFEGVEKFRKQAEAVARPVRQPLRGM